MRVDGSLALIGYASGVLAKNWRSKVPELIPFEQLTILNLLLDQLA